MLGFVMVKPGWFVYFLITKLLLQAAVTVSKTTFSSQVFMSFHEQPHQAVSLGGKRCLVQD